MISLDDGSIVCLFFFFTFSRWKCFSLKKRIKKVKNFLLWCIVFARFCYRKTLFCLSLFDHERVRSDGDIYDLWGLRFQVQWFDEFHCETTSITFLKFWYSNLWATKTKFLKGHCRYCVLHLEMKYLWLKYNTGF